MASLAAGRAISQRGGRPAGARSAVLARLRSAPLARGGKSLSNPSERHLEDSGHEDVGKADGDEVLPRHRLQLVFPQAGIGEAHPEHQERHRHQLREQHERAEHVGEADVVDAGNRPAAQEQRRCQCGEGERGAELADEEEEEAEARVLDHVAGHELALGDGHVEGCLRELRLCRDQEQGEAHELGEDERVADEVPAEDRAVLLGADDALEAHRVRLHDHTDDRQQQRQLVGDELRGRAQLIAYELPLLLAVVGVVVQANTMSLQGIVGAQQNGAIFGWDLIGNPFILTQFVGFALFLVAAQAELTQTPFDMPVAESELVSGYMVEYTGFRFLFFFIGEFGTAFAFAALAATLFLGGWAIPGVDDVGLANVLGPLVLFAKLMAVAFLMFWVRFTYPRLREDQLQAVAWKYLIPIGLANILVTGAS